MEDRSNRSAKNPFSLSRKKGIFMKPKKQTVTMGTKYQRINDARGVSIKTATIEGEVYYSVVDFLKYLLLLDKSELQMTRGYIANELYNMNITSNKFWDNADNAQFFEVVLKHINNYGDWVKGDILNAFFSSAIVTEEIKLQYLNTAENIPTKTYNFVSKQTSIPPKVRATLISRFKADEEVLLDLILAEEEKEVLSAALTQVDITKLTSQNLISIYIQEARLNDRKRIDLIKKATNIEVLKHIIFTDNNFEVVKAARQRLKEIPNSIKLISELTA